MDLGLAGKRAIVVGGTRGIGRAIVETLLDEGCDVAFCARNAEQVADAAATLTSRNPGRRAVGRSVDAADHDALRTFVDAAAGELGGLDVLVMNASAALGGGNDVESWQRGIEVDMLGTHAACEAALPHLERGEESAIVIVGTISSVDVGGPRRAYNSVKAAMLPYVKAIARDCAPRVRANVVAPGQIFFEGGVWDFVRVADPDRYADALARNPMGRMGTPAEIASVVAFVASPRASFMSGAHVLCDGARTTGVQY